MAPHPDVPPDLIRDVLDTGEETRPNATKAAEEIAQLIGRPVTSALIRSAIERHREWSLPPALDGRPTAMVYAVEEALGPISKEHKTSHHLKKMRAWERYMAELVTLEGGWMEKVEEYILTRITTGTVADYDPDDGWMIRLCLPWEIGHYFRRPIPRNGGAAPMSLIRDFVDYGPATYSAEVPDGRPVEVKITAEHVALWRKVIESGTAG